MSDKLSYGETLPASGSTHYYTVEMKIPQTYFGEDRPKLPSEISWGRYVRSAFTDSRNPGNPDAWKDRTFRFDYQNVDLFKNVMPGEGFDFLDPADAIAVARQLRQTGRFGAGWAGPEPWRIRYRSPLVDVRVVEIQSLRMEREVYP